jgi:hypothetical protein
LGVPSTPPRIRRRLDRELRRPRRWTGGHGTCRRRVIGSDRYAGERPRPTRRQQACLHHRGGRLRFGRVLTIGGPSCQIAPPPSTTTRRARRRS